MTASVQSTIVTTLNALAYPSCGIEPDVDPNASEYRYVPST